MIVKPVGDKILVKLDKKEENNSAGLYIPESVLSSDAPVEGVVVEVGSGILTHSGNRVPLDVKVGDNVLCRKIFATAVELSINGEEFLLMTENDILGVIER